LTTLGKASGDRRLVSFAEVLLDQAIAAAVAGNRRKGLELLAQVVELDPRIERAWLWLAELVETDGQRIECLERVVSINPGNSLAQQRLRTLTGETPGPPTARGETHPPTEPPTVSPPPPVATGLGATPSPSDLAPVVRPAVSPVKPAGISTWRIIASVTILLAICAGVYILSGSPNGKDSTPSTLLMVGDNATLYDDQGVPILVAVDYESLEAAIQASVANDDYGAHELVLTGRLFSVNSGTKVLVTDLALYATEVRILEGPYEGRKVWVVDEVLRPQ
jgi:hypothetical protein